MDEWLPENHLARFIVEVIEQLNLSKLTHKYAGRGSAAHHPAVLLGLLVYGYATGVFSSRKIERATYDSVAFRYIAANTHPDHDTLTHFRKSNLTELEDLFVQVLSLAQSLKLVRLGQIAVDGTKIKANASKHKALSHGHIEKLEAQLRDEVQALLAQAAAADREGAGRWRRPVGGSGAPGRPVAGVGGSQGQKQGACRCDVRAGTAGLRGEDRPP